MLAEVRAWLVRPELWLSRRRKPECNTAISVQGVLLEGTVPTVSARAVDGVVSMMYGRLLDSRSSQDIYSSRLPSGTCDLLTT